MIKSELKRAVVISLKEKGIFNTPDKIIEQAVEQTILEMTKELNTPDGSLYLRGFGTFKNVLTARKIGRNITKGIPVIIEPRRKVSFKQSAKFEK